MKSKMNDIWVHNVDGNNGEVSAMKNKTFRISAGVCLGAVLLACTNLLTVPVALAWGQGGHVAIANLSNSAEKSLLPAVAAGLIVLLASGRLRLWQCSALSLSMLILYTLIQNFVSPLVNILVLKTTESYSVSLSGIAFHFREAGYYLFPVFIGALAFYGIACKKRVTALLCMVWSLVNWLLFHILPPFFPKFDGVRLAMDGGTAVRIQIYYGLLNWAAILLIFFIIADLYSLKANSPKDNSLGDRKDSIDS